MHTVLAHGWMRAAGYALLARLRGLLTPGIALLAFSTVQAPTAQAQSPVCGQIRAELAQLGRSSGSTAQAARLRAELGKVRFAMQRNDCGRSGFLGIGGPPPICGPLRGQAAQFEAQLRQIEGGGGQRRAQLVAALDRYGCNAPAQRGVIYASPDQPSLFERLFGEGSNGSVDRRDDQPLDPDAEFRERLGGRMAVCVRTCDGFFFPVNFEGIGARDEYAEVCQSLCPGAETRLFFMPGGADIERAATRDGTPYMSLPNAKAYTRQRDPACFCKQPGQTWASAMKGVEDIVEARKGDIIVTKEQATAMSRPKEIKAAEARQPRKTRRQLALEALAAEEAKKKAENAENPPESALPTGGTASAGIGPRTVENRTINATGGVRQQTTDANGVKRTVRNVAPELTGKERPIDLRGEARP